MSAKIGTAVFIIWISCSLSCSSKQNQLRIDKDQYKDRLKGFWLGSCIANWTGLPTENQRTGFPFYTDSDFGPDKFDYVLNQDPWGADDDTDIEYVYQYAIEKFKNPKLSGKQISAIWQDHIGLPKLWVSNKNYNLQRSKRPHTEHFGPELAFRLDRMTISNDLSKRETFQI